MKETELHETVASLAALLKQTTQKRLVWPEGVNKSDHSKYPLDNFGLPVSNYEIIEPAVEYHNVLFSPEQVETIKRKFLKLVEEL